MFDSVRETPYEETIQGLGTLRSRGGPTASALLPVIWLRSRSIYRACLTAAGNFQSNDTKVMRRIAAAVGVEK